VFGSIRAGAAKMTKALGTNVVTSDTARDTSEKYSIKYKNFIAVILL